MTRRSPKSIDIKPVKCDKVYPREDTRKSIDELKSVGLKLNKE